MIASNLGAERGRRRRLHGSAGRTGSRVRLRARHRLAAARAQVYPFASTMNGDGEGNPFAAPATLNLDEGAAPSPARPAASAAALRELAAGGRWARWLCGLTVATIAVAATGFATTFRYVHGARLARMLSLLVVMTLLEAPFVLALFRHARATARLPGGDGLAVERSIQTLAAYLKSAGIMVG